jgi:protein O-mannosyl-transferase
VAAPDKRNRKKQAVPPPLAEPPAKRLNWDRLWPYLALAVLAFVVYSNALANGFAADDDSQLLQNPLVVNYREIPHLFGQDIWAFSKPVGATPSNYYRPIQILLYMALYYVGNFNPVWFHAVMLLIHVANTLLVFRLAVYFMPDSRQSALAAATLFAVHPIHNEAVVWVAVLPDIFMTLLALTMILLFVLQDARPTPKQIAVHVGLFLVALFTKETAAVLLPLMAGYEWLYLRRDLRQIWANRNLYMSLTAAFGFYLVMRMYALGGLAPAQGGHFHLTGSELLLSMIALMGRYLASLIFPPELSYFHVFYPTGQIDLVVVASLLAIVGLLATIFLVRRTEPMISFGLVLILLPLLPVMNINGVGENVFTERYLYLPSVGFVWIAAWAWGFLLRRRILSRSMAWSLLGLLLGTYTAIGWARTPDWRDDVHLYSVTLRQYPGLASLRNSLGAAYELQGKHREAIREFQQALALEPDKPDIYYNMGKALENSDQDAPAEAAYEKALRMRPDFTLPMNNLARFRRQERNYQAALQMLKRAVDLRPDFEEAWINLGLTYIDVQDYPAAFHALQMGLQLDPPGRQPFVYIGHYGLGVCYARMGDLTRAEKELTLALRDHPNFAEARTELQRLQGMHR